MKASYIIVYGDPANGFSFIGPFEYHGDARRHAEQEIQGDYWWIAPIEQPVEDK